VHVEGGTAAARGAKRPPRRVAGPPADALRTPSGLASKVLQVGLGSIRPTARSVVRVHYTGWTPDGQMFDSSVAKGDPIEMSVDQFIPGWIEGLQLMIIGEKRRFWIPGHLAYGEPSGPARPGDPPKGMLVFDIELLDIR
jgi:FKBP-type peptidyl-prolyl cis-trans isomerase